MTTATAISEEIGADAVVADHKRRVYWVPGDHEGNYPDVMGYRNVPQTANK